VLRGLTAGVEEPPNVRRSDESMATPLSPTAQIRSIRQLHPWHPILPSTGMAIGIHQRCDWKDAKAYEGSD
jgi:hypothetical protein